METVKNVRNPRAGLSGPKKADADRCALSVSAKLISLNGGVVLSVCILLSAISAASAYTGRLVVSQSLLFLFLSLMSWIYLVDSVSEKLCLTDGAIRRTSLFGRTSDMKLGDVKSLLLKHEGLNASVGIESLTVTYADGKVERMPLGPCWRHRELEDFLESVEQVMGYDDVVDQMH